MASTPGMILAAIFAATSVETPVDGVMVEVPRTPPVVVSTFPAQGAAVRPGVLILKVTYDQAMDAEAWSFTPAASGALPDCLDKPRLLDDRKTFVLLCTAQAGATFGIGFNGAGDQPGFASSGGRTATPFTLSFGTQDRDAVNTLKEALALADLRPQDNPVMSSKPGAR